jgi:hypothetical protein
MDWGKFIAALAAALAALFDKLALFSAGRMSKNLEIIGNDLEKLEDAARAAGRVELMSDADVVSELRRRGLYRLRDQSSDRRP